MDGNHTISALNAVIAACKDREECFQFCLDQLRDGESALQALLAEGRVACALAAGELQGLVRMQGGEPETTVTLSGAFRRNWLDIKSVFGGFDRAAILDECDNAADRAGRACHRALETNASPRVRQVLERQYRDLLRDRDRISSLRGTTPRNEAPSARS